MQLDKNQLYTIEEVANLLRVARITIKRYIKNGKMPSVKFEGVRRIKGEDLLKILNNKKYYAKQMA